MMKRMLKIPFLFLVLMTFLSAAPFFWKYVHQIGSDQDKYFKKVYNLYVSSFGSGGTDCVEEVIRGYDAPYFTDLRSARKLIVYVINSFSKSINSNEKLRPYLKEYPFPVERLTINIGFQENLNGKFKDQKQIVYVSLINGKLFYSYDTHTRRGYENLHKETFAEAIAIVAAENTSQLLIK